MEQAVCLCAPSEHAGIREEHEWLAEHYTGGRIRAQSLQFKIVDGKRRAYDILEIETADGRQETVYFDITWFYGKW